MKESEYSKIISFKHIKYMMSSMYLITVDRFDLNQYKDDNKLFDFINEWWVINTIHNERLDFMLQGDVDLSMWKDFSKQISSLLGECLYERI